MSRQIYGYTVTGSPDHSHAVCEMCEKQKYGTAEECVAWGKTHKHGRAVRAVQPSTHLEFFR